MNSPFWACFAAIEFFPSLFLVFLLSYVVARFLHVKFRTHVHAVFLLPPSLLLLLGCHKHFYFFGSTRSPHWYRVPP